MRKWLVASFAGAAVLGSAAQAQEWVGNGEIIAAYYNEEMSVPRGWSLSYDGNKDGIENFTFSVDYATSTPLTRSLSAEGQLKRLLCDGDLLESWVRAGMRAAAGKAWFDGANYNVDLPREPITCN